jgi:hypothetical protein
MKNIHFAILLSLISVVTLFGVASNAYAATTPFSGLNVSLVDAAGRTVGSGITDSSGRFSFKQIQVGKYTIVCMMQPHVEKPTMKNGSGEGAATKIVMTVSGKGVKKSPVKIKGKLSESHHSVTGSIWVTKAGTVECVCYTS